MKALGLLLAAILVPGAMAMAIKERRPLLEPSQQKWYPCGYYLGCYSVIHGSVEVIPRFEPTVDPRSWSALQRSNPDSFANMRPWNGTSPFLQRLQRFRKDIQQ